MAFTLRFLLSLMLTELLLRHIWSVLHRVWSLRVSSIAFALCNIFAIRPELTILRGMPIEILLLRLLTLLKLSLLGLSPLFWLMILDGLILLEANPIAARRVLCFAISPCASRWFWNKSTCLLAYIVWNLMMWRKPTTLVVSETYVKILLCLLLESLHL